jgi:hypothetical protein
MLTRDAQSAFAPRPAPAKCCISERKLSRPAEQSRACNDYRPAFRPVPLVAR